MIDVLGLTHYESFLDEDVFSRATIGTVKNIGR
jgi:hypothetical protein